MISGYRAMWVIILFDLPVKTKKQQKAAMQFRKHILDEGYFMKQFSVYMKYFINRTKSEASAKRISKKIPQYGKVSVVYITDKQFGNIQNFYGKIPQKADKKPTQFALF